MTEEERETGATKRKRVLETGRLLGVISRIDPEVYQAIKEESEKNGVPPHELMVGIIKKYFLFQQVQQANLTTEQLLIAWDVLERMLRFSMWLHASLATTFFSEMTEQFARMIDQRVKEYTEMLERREREVKGRDIQSRLADMLMPMLEGFISTFVKSFYKSAGQPIPESLKLRVPVSISGVDEATSQSSEEAPA